MGITRTINMLRVDQIYVWGCILTLSCFTTGVIMNPSADQINEATPVNFDVQELQYRIGLQMNALNNIEDEEQRVKEADILYDSLIDALGQLSEIQSGSIPRNEAEEGWEKNTGSMPDGTLPEVHEGMQWIKMINQMPFEFNWNGRYETPSYRHGRHQPGPYKAHYPQMPNAWYPGDPTPVGYPHTPSMYYYPQHVPMPHAYPMGGMQQYPPYLYQRTHPGAQMPMGSHAQSHPDQYPIPGRYPMGGMQHSSPQWHQESPDRPKNE